MTFRTITVLLLLSLATLAHATVPPNPHLTIQLPGFGTWLFTEIESELVIVQPTSGIPVDFSWSADADFYGGTIAGYRYGWDLLDPADTNDPGWMSPGFVPDLLAAVPVDFMPGMHTFHVMVSDGDGAWTLAGFLLNVVSPVPVHMVNWGTLKSSYRNSSK